MKRINQAWCVKRRGKKEFVLEINTNEGNLQFVISFFQAVALHNSIEKLVKRMKFWKKA